MHSVRGRESNAVPPARLDVNWERGVEALPVGALDEVRLINEEVLWSCEKMRIYEFTVKWDK